ncbi:iron uptake system protein EfeO [Pseudomonas citronellolis]|uniref:iron uptake system protein EfeO n=1 Tax=Pseudomonas citronellolis TaxID=53408 RepID=UPI0023E38158|nr:iron uptake system protein EfeO [Pseudomonas citronellolis]MDF3932458.1 iron uptake system protein EfeO [Pseudomonas citronellolis]
MSLPEARPPVGARRLLLNAAVAASAALALLGAAAFYYAARHAHQAKLDNDEVRVTVQAHGCAPNALSVPAGQARFRILNHSDRAVEWEILDGVMVVEERENIAPGMSQPLSVYLNPGDYQITCGLLSNPRGSLHVTPSAAASAAQQARSPLLDFVGPLSEYRVYLAGQLRQLQRALEALDAALAAGDLDAARNQYLAGRAAYQRIAASAQRFAELDNRIAPRADAFEQRERDPAFGGFHRLEYGLYAQGSTTGLAPVAQRLQADVAALKDALMAQALPPEQLSGNAARLLHNLAEQRVSGDEERYSHSDLAGFVANLEGARKVIDLLRPLLSAKAPALPARLDGAADALGADLTQLAGRPYDQVTPAQRQQLAVHAAALADALDTVAPVLGLGHP